jgi:hypothetical protein
MIVKAIDEMEEACFGHFEELGIVSLAELTHKEDYTGDERIVEI